MNSEIEIFGQTPTAAVKKTRRGLYMKTNMKHKSCYVSRELKDVLFPAGSKSGKVLIIHSKIEKTWYIAAAIGDLFKGGYECVANDVSKPDSIFRINGASDVMNKMITEMTDGNVEEITYTLDVERTSVEYDKMNLHKITLSK